ncbi:MAG: hypothetical protein WKF47_01840 [Geodermatophilaceae bacterium]
MLDALANTLIGAALVLAALTSVLSYLRRPTPRPVSLAVLGLAAAVLLQAVIAIVIVIGGDRPADLGTFVGYALASVLVLPAAIAWSRAEPGRWGNGVLAVGCLTLSVMIVRMGQLWDMTSG